MEDVIKFIESNVWTFAKTMAYIPHEYAVLSKSGKREDYVKFAKFIQENGVTEYFGKRKYKYLYLDGYKYWSMDFPIERTDLINRAKI